MKCLIKKFAVVLLLPVCTLLTGCNQVDVDLFWDGKWQRTIKVPKNVQGRCYEETLTIASKQWQLDAVVHSTFACDQPFLELTYQGTLEEVKIKNNSGDNHVRFQISDIRLTAMIDVAGDQRDALSEAAVEKLSEKYVPPEFQFFEQTAFFDSKRATMRSNLFLPLRDLAIPKYPNNNAVFKYRRSH